MPRHQKKKSPQSARAIGRRLHLGRIMCDVSLCDMAHYCHVCPRAIWQIEHGKRVIDPQIITQYSHLLHIDEQIFLGTDPGRAYRDYMFSRRNQWPKNQ